jgi:hypothetical protein
MYNVIEMIEGVLKSDSMIDDVELGMLIDDFYEVYVSDERDEDCFIKWGGDCMVEIQMDENCNYKIWK